MASFRVVLNPSLNDTINFAQWSITGESPQFSIENDNLSYHLILGDKPRLDVYNLEIDPFTHHREIGQIIKSYELVGAGYQILSKI